VNALRLRENFRAVVPMVAGVGNALMALPMVRQLKTVARAGHITIIARLDAMAEPFRRISEVDKVLVTGNGLKNQRGAIAQTRRCHADLFLVPFPSNRWQYAMWALLSGAGRSALNSYPVGRIRAMHFIGTRLPAQQGLHDVEQNLRLLTMLGVDPDMSEAPRFNLSDDDRRRASELLDEIGLGDDRPFVAVHAGSARTVLAESKRWPAAKYAALIGAIRNEMQVQVVLLEGPDETGVADEITAKMRDESAKPLILRLVGNLGVAAGVLERATLYAGSDSGLAHLAGAVGTKPVTIFAPADPDRVCPFGYRDLVVKPAKSCSPCFLYPWQATKPKVRCGRHGQPMCITEVTVEQVMATVRRALLVPSPCSQGEG
jgi:ADP-heptose:LPS heptosyltransferase